VPLIDSDSKAQFAPDSPRLSGPDKGLIRVLICDPDPLLRTGVRAVLELSLVGAIVGEVDDARRILDEADRLGADSVVLSSGSLTDDDGTPRQLGEMLGGLRCPIILLVDADEVEIIAEAIRLGVRGLVGRQSAGHDLELAIPTTASGEAFLSPSLTLPLFRWLTSVIPKDTGRLQAAVSALSGREREVFGLIGQGKTNVEISKLLRIRETTVRSHVSHILTKLHLRTRSEAVIMGYQCRTGSAG